MTEAIFVASIGIVSSLVASGGLWTYLQNRDIRKGASTQLLLGMAHTRIVTMGSQFIERGYITNYEYDDFMKYLCKPYSKFGGNGLADRVIAEVKKLPIKSSPIVLMQPITIPNEEEE